MGTRRPGARSGLDRRHDEGAQHQLGVAERLVRDRVAEYLAPPEDRELETRAEALDARPSEPHPIGPAAATWTSTFGNAAASSSATFW